MMDVFEIILAVVLVGFTIWVVLRMGDKSRKKKTKDSPQTQRDRAVWAWARIVTSTHGAAGLGGMVRVTLELEVHLPGTPPFTATTTWLVEQEALAYVEMGKEISLKVDPQDLKYIYPNGPWAKVVE
ncbi:MAG: hypothetical protein NTV38_05040 [Chloroflexi bacterium]|nr:hypothetical protein [Chloroflexota bacterium]